MWSPLTNTPANVSGIFSASVCIYTSHVFACKVLLVFLWLLMIATDNLEIVIARVLMDKQTQEAFEIVLSKVFSAVKSKHPLFQPGKTLRGILTDWSYTQRAALSTVLGEELVTELCKGCKVLYFMQTVKRVAKWVVQGSNHQQRALESIGYAIPRATTEKAVDDLFDEVGGTKPVAAAAVLYYQNLGSWKKTGLTGGKGQSTS